MWWCLELALKKRLAAVIQVVQKGHLLRVLRFRASESYSLYGFRKYHNLRKKSHLFDLINQTTFSKAEVT
jgi:hypothetical protein